MMVEVAAIHFLTIIATVENEVYDGPPEELYFQDRFLLAKSYFESSFCTLCAMLCYI